MDKLHWETSRLWLDLIASDDDKAEKEESVLPGGLESFQLMRNTIVKDVIYGNNHNKNSKWWEVKNKTGNEITWESKPEDLIELLLIEINSILNPPSQSSTLISTKHGFDIP